MNSMESGSATCKSRDMLAKPWLAFAVFWLPAILIFVAGTSRFSGGLRTVVWTVALAIMGTACLANARRCGRVHCYLTGPFFLVMAIVTLLYGLGVVPQARHGWNWIGMIILAGALAFCCLPEMILGKYRPRS
ncbi:MAG TPA: hypothetical protein VEG63_13505 [Candidatus Acidoferrales bacterium]|nr:hypothetical protein [Candidatus Acidoferrales bacterium]